MMIDAKYVIPRVGDQWHFKMPNKRKQTKVIWMIVRQQHQSANGDMIWKYRVHWKREPRGRHSSIRVRYLLMYGNLIRRKK